MAFRVRRKGISYKRASIKKSKNVKKMTRSVERHVPRGPSCPFPLTMTKKLTYSAHLNLTQSVLTTPVNWFFRANSLYDPDFTGGGNQPRYFDQLCGADGGNAIYNRYRVLASNISLKIFPTATSSVDGNGLISVYPLNAGSSGPNGINEMKERPYCRYIYTTVLGSAKPYSLNNKIGIAKFIGNRDLHDNEDSGAQYNQNPTDTVLWGLTGCALSSSGLLNVQAMVTITYLAQFYVLNDVANS